MNSNFAVFILALTVEVNAQGWLGGRGGGEGGWKPPCGLPPFLQHLNQEAQSKITSIWRNYREGSDCESEHQQTRELLRSLPRPVPPFLQGLPQNVLARFEAIFKDHSTPFKQKRARIDALAREVLTGDNLRKFLEFKAMREKGEVEFRRKEASLSPAAQQANQHMKTLQGREKFTYLRGLPENVRQEMMEMWKSRGFGMGMGGGGGRWGGRHRAARNRH